MRILVIKMPRFLARLLSRWREWEWTQTERNKLYGTRRGARHERSPSAACGGRLRIRAADRRAQWKSFLKRNARSVIGRA